MYFQCSTVFEASRKFFNEDRPLVSQPLQLPTCSMFSKTSELFGYVFSTRNAIPFCFPGLIPIKCSRFRAMATSPSHPGDVCCLSLAYPQCCLWSVVQCGCSSRQVAKAWVGTYTHHLLGPGVVCINLQGGAPFLNSPQSCLLFSVLSIFIAIVLRYFCWLICLYPSPMHTLLSLTSLPQIENIPLSN